MKMRFLRGNGRRSPMRQQENYSGEKNPGSSHHFALETVIVFGRGLYRPYEYKGTVALEVEVEGEDRCAR